MVSIAQSFVALLAFVVMVKCEMHLGGCPKSVQAMKPFDVGQYVGVWYEIRKTPAIFEMGLKCNQANYTGISEGKISVENKGQREDDGSIDDILGEAVVADPNEPARLLVTFPTSPFPAPYAVIKTDYKQYTVVLSCTDMGVANYSIMWVLSRTRVLPEAAELEIKNFFAEHKDLDYLSQKLINTDQTGCNL